jgi:hypothetical protein
MTSKMQLLTVVCTVFLAADSNAWNNTGHMTVAELAWRKLSSSERTAVSQLLAHHPNFSELLDVPAGPGHDEIVFLRAATWPDLVRPPFPGQPPKPAYTNFHRGDWHFVDFPFIATDDLDEFAASEHQPKITNAVERLAVLEAELQSNHSASNRAIALCWYLHLVGDLHQPLHCASWFSPEYKNGDTGGNEVAIKPHSAAVKLHSFWDGLLGGGESRFFINQVADDIANDPLLQRNKLGELTLSTTYSSWADESFEAAHQSSYLEGQLAHTVYKKHLLASAVPTLNDHYEDNSRKIARRRVALAGFRLADKLKAIY